MTAIVALDKPQGMLSRHAGVRVGRILSEKKVGHAGTLDPLATGVLPVLLGRATKLAPFLEDKKRYIATMQFGLKTDTGDITGQVVARSDVLPSAAQLTAVLPQFIGCVIQTPPVYSALKKDGKPLYAYARQGQPLEAAPRAAQIYELKLSEIWDNDVAVLEVLCASGTYVRTLIEDIAAAIGALATMSGLRRTRASGIDIADCVTLETLERGEGKFISPESLFTHCGAVVLPQDGFRYYLNGGTIDGRRLMAKSSPTDWPVREETGQALAVASRLPHNHPLYEEIIVPPPSDEIWQDSDFMNKGQGKVRWAGTLCRAYAPDGAFIGLGQFFDGAVKSVWLESVENE